VTRYKSPAALCTVIVSTYSTIGHTKPDKTTTWPGRIFLLSTLHLTHYSMSISVLEITPTAEQTPPRSLSPSEIEDGHYQPTPSRRWHHLLLDSLTPMALRLRSQPHPHYPYVSDKPRTSTSKTKEEYVVTETPIALSRPEPLHMKRSVQVIAVIRLVCVLVPVTILCLL
jgi:hypothetical protein